MSTTKRSVPLNGKTDSDSPRKRRNVGTPAPRNGDKTATSHTKARAQTDGKNQAKKFNARGSGRDGKPIQSTNSSAEAHALQRTQTIQRKAARPHADSIARAKKIWERLRRKSHVPVEERRQLVAELFSLISGHIQDFVFKHDSVRTVQCALKYANAEQRRQIARELQGKYRELCQSKYAKFLVAKVLQEGDDEARGWVMAEFEGWVKKGINHPEASWIMDDAYRAVATPEQKRTLLREWFGPEFAIFKEDATDAMQRASLSETKDSPKLRSYDPAQDLLDILTEQPAKRQPILTHLFGMINQLLQKRMTAFTMLHDAMLAYSVAVGHPSSSSLAQEWIELLKPSAPTKSDPDAGPDGDDTDGYEQDLLLNLAFTKSGSRVVARALALSTAKERKLLLRPYRTQIETMACDSIACAVLIAAMECVDDTVLLSKLLHADLLAAKLPTDEERFDAIAALGVHPVGRVVLLWPLSVSDVHIPTILVREGSHVERLASEVRQLREETSKKDPRVRRSELIKALSTQSNGAIVATIQNRAETLVNAGALGCHFIIEVLLGAHGDKTAALEAISALAAGDPTEDAHVSKSVPVGRMLKTLVAGTRPQAKVPVDDNTGVNGLENTAVLPFAPLLWSAIEPFAVAWATSNSSFVIANLLETPAIDASTRDHVLRKLRVGKTETEQAAENGNKGAAVVLAAL